jgi:hypothetical protein
MRAQLTVRDMSPAPERPIVIDPLSTRAPLEGSMHSLANVLLLAGMLIRVMRNRMPRAVAFSFLSQ